MDFLATIRTRLHRGELSTRDAKVVAWTEIRLPAATLRELGKVRGVKPPTAPRRAKLSDAEAGGSSERQTMMGKVTSFNRASFAAIDQNNS